MVEDCWCTSCRFAIGCPSKAREKEHKRRRRDKGGDGSRKGAKSLKVVHPGRPGREMQRWMTLKPAPKLPI